jgi:hypothetical protein
VCLQTPNLPGVFIYILARFDVQRSDKDAFSVASVVKVDFSGSVKRILFHFAKTSSDRDEWVEFESPRIAPLYSKVPKRRKGDSKPSQTSVGTAKNSLNDTGTSDIQEDLPSKSNQPQVVSRLKGPVQQKLAADPSDEKSFVVGGMSSAQKFVTFPLLQILMLFVSCLKLSSMYFE